MLDDETLRGMMPPRSKVAGFILAPRRVVPSLARAASNTKTRSAFTLVELLVVIAIIGILVALLLPAVQAARESSRRMGCENNVRQSMLGFLNFHDSKGGFPNRMTVGGSTSLTTGHGWGLELLPFVEQGPLFRSWNTAKSFFDPENQSITMTPVQMYLCPSAPNGPRVMDLSSATTTTSTGIAGDYVVFHQITTTGTTATCNPCNSAAPKTANTLTPISAISDGTSNTIMIGEGAGRSDYYISGVKQASNTSMTNPKFWGCWASYQSVTMQGWSAATPPAAGGVFAMNRTNSQGVYSFHPGGSNFGKCDGSVHFLAEDISMTILIALTTRDAGDSINEY